MLLLEDQDIIMNDILITIAIIIAMKDMMRYRDEKFKHDQAQAIQQLVIIK